MGRAVGHGLGDIHRYRGLSIEGRLSGGDCSSPSAVQDNSILALKAYGYTLPMNKQRLIEERILARHRIVAERLQADPQAVLAHARANLERWARSYPIDQIPGWLQEWRDLLEHPLAEILEILVSESENARRLRSSSPFAGIVSPRERWAIHREINDDP